MLAIYTCRCIVNAMRVAWLMLIACLCVESARAASPLVYAEACDASAGAALSNELFVIANDEDNVLRFYRRGSGGRPVATQRLDFLDAADECDLEGVARASDRLYWIASHGRNKKGKPRPSRHRFFATTAAAAGARTSLAPVGTPYRGLVAAMIAEPKLSGLELATAEPLAPEAPGGLNIEGLVALPDGALLIGFRNPLREKRAILVPLLNPAEVVAGKAPAFGAPLLLDLGGRGIRGLERLDDGRFVILAGPPGDTGSFAVYTWSGDPNQAPVASSASIGTLRPEGLVRFPDGGLTLISDDGGVEVNGGECKDLPDASARSFRALELKLSR
jgi:hypothetical protein